MRENFYFATHKIGHERENCASFKSRPTFYFKHIIHEMYAFCMYHCESSITMLQICITRKCTQGNNESSVLLFNSIYQLGHYSHNLSNL